EDGGTLWFLTRATSDVAADAPQRPVNVAVQDKDFWASLAGHGQLVRDDARKKEFWNPATEAFFGEGSSPEDPQIVLVRVDVQTAQFWESPGAVATAVELVKAKVTGGTAEPGDSETVRF
ncbi:stress protein, partial [Micrococcus luteus]|nr:stress protein [Micrococcus luteus]